MKSRQYVRAQLPRRSGGTTNATNSSKQNGDVRNVARSVETQVKPNWIAEAALYQAPVAFIVCDPDCKITLANAMACQVAGSDPRGQSMKSAPSRWGKIVDAEGRTVSPDEWPWIKALNDEVAVSQEIELIAQDGKSLHAQIIASPIRGGDGQIQGAVTIFADISNRKLQEFNRIYEVLTAERTRIAGNIHDNVSQGLNASILHLRAVRKEMADYVRVARTHLAKAIETSMCSLAEARRATSIMSYDLAEAEDPGMYLRNFAQQIFSGSTIELEFCLQNPAKSLPADTRLELVRIGKETLNNIVKHARASKVCVGLRYTKHVAVLNISDNGQGFALMPSSQVNEGFGLSSMRSRARQVGGNVRIESQPGGGTTVIALLPV
jgi:signal transduction histidine kinase